MKISEVMSILQKYKEEYGDINVALISNIGEQNTVNNIDVLSFYDTENPDVTENIVIIRDQFDYNQFTGAEYEPSEEDWENGYPGYEITEKEIEDPDSDYWDSGCPIEDKTEDKKDTESWIPWELM